VPCNGSLVELPEHIKKFTQLYGQKLVNGSSSSSAATPSQQLIMVSKLLWNLMKRKEMGTSA
jgi:hypothetical protein